MIAFAVRLLTTDFKGLLPSVRVIAPTVPGLGLDLRGEAAAVVGGVEVLFNSLGIHQGFSCII